jgi:hypothetical protein
MGKRDSKTQAKDDFDEAALWEQFESQPAQFTCEMAEGMEKRAKEAELPHGITRRIALASLTRSASDLIGAIKDDRDAAEALAESSQAISDMVKHLGAVCEVLTTARTRIEMALCVRDDMHEIMGKLEQESVDA